MESMIQNSDSEKNTNIGKRQFISDRSPKATKTLDFLRKYEHIKGSFISFKIITHLITYPPLILEYSGECPRATDKRFKRADKMVKVKNKAWHSEGVGGQQVLEGFQCCLAHCSLKELVPEEHSY